MARCAARYGFALSTSASAVFLTRWISPFVSTTVFDLFQGAVVLSAWYGGLGPGILTAITSILALDYFFIPPLNAFGVNFTDFLRLAVFGGVAVLTSSLSARLKKAKSDLQYANDELELRVRQRTKELAQTNESFKNQTRLFQSVLSNMNDAVVMIDLQRRFTPVNSAAKRLFGNPLRDLSTESASDELGIYKLDRMTLYRFDEMPFTKALHGEFTDEVLEMFIRNPQVPEGMWATCVGSPLKDDDGIIRGGVMVFRDVSDRKNAEREVLEIANREQRRLGRDLHDGLCQTLAGLKLISEDLKEKLAAKSLPETKDLEIVESRLGEALAQVDMVSRGLYPVELETNGLMAALEELADKISKVHTVDCQLKCQKSILINNGAVATHLYRIAQEAVINAIKGGRAKHITIRLFARGPHMVLSIADDGTGFSAKPSRNGMGLKIMDYRARMINASLQIRSNPMSGTLVSCSLPMGSERASAKPLTQLIE